MASSLLNNRFAILLGRFLLLSHRITEIRATPNLSANSFWVSFNFNRSAFISCPVIFNLNNKVTQVTLSVKSFFELFFKIDTFSLLRNGWVLTLFVSTMIKIIKYKVVIIDFLENKP